jgi:hypothetical protein
MTWEQCEHELEKHIVRHDAGFGYLYMPREVLDAMLQVAYKAGCVHGGTTCERIVKHAFAAAVKGESNG